MSIDSVSKKSNVSYSTYTTEAIVCGSSLHNSSDGSYLLFTKEAGMLLAHARSVREERSRQRQALQEFSRIRVSLVKGKTGWRIGSVEALGNPFLSASSRTVRTTTAQVVKLLRRYVQGESAVPDLFQDAEDTIDALSSGNDIDHVLLLEIFEVRLLQHLGYVAIEPELKEVLTVSVYEACKKCTVSQRQLIEQMTAQATSASHL